MKRRLFNAGALVSLVLCVAVAGLWARSYWRGDNILYSRPTWTVQLISNQGQLECRLIERSWPGAGGFLWRADIQNSPRSWENLLRFGYLRWWSPSSGDVHHDLKFPHWTPVLILAALPTMRLWLAQRAERTPDSCASCGYNLHGIPEGKTCPECGAATGGGEP